MLTVKQIDFNKLSLAIAVVVAIIVVMCLLVMWCVAHAASFLTFMALLTLTMLVFAVYTIL